MQTFTKYADLLAWVEQEKSPTTFLGCAPDGAPVISIRTGGDKTPAVFISAGSHATEQAGVSAAVALVEQLKTDHQVHIIPTRDPIGMNGFAYALGLSLEETPQLNSLEEIPGFLRAHGDILYQRDEVMLVLIGEYGYSTHNLYNKIDHGDPRLEPLWGSRIFFPSRDGGIEGTAPMQRAYTLIVTPDGEVLHINRFHDTSWAPVECRCTRRLMAKIQPALTLDLHEYGKEAFWFSARHQQTEEDEMWEKRMAVAMLDAIAGSETPLVAADYIHQTFFEKDEDGVQWLLAKNRGEGLNLADFAADQYGPSFTIETGMQRSFQSRVDAAVLAAQTAVSVFEDRYA